MAIMGPPRQFRLGVPVRPSELGTPNPVIVKVGLFQQGRAWWTSRTPIQRRATAAGAAGIVLAALALTYLARAGAPGGQPAAVAVSPAPAAVTPVPPAVSPQLPMAPPPTGGQESVPILPPTVAIGVSTATFGVPPVPPPPAAAIATPAKPTPLPPVAVVVAPAPARATQDNEKPPAAVVLDASGKPAPGLPAGAPPAAAVGKPPAQPAPPPVATAPVATPAMAGGGKLATPTREVPAVGGAEAKTEAAGPRVIVVDIDKSGSFALITNPQTRLPEKVSAGQKIFTGETIKKIDPAAGKIQLDSRTITMQ